MRALAIAFALAVVAIRFLATTVWSDAIFGLMGGLAFVAVLGFARVRLRGRRLGAPAVAAIVAVAITVDELLQLAFPARTFSWIDLGAGYAGIAVFSTLAALVLRRMAPEAPETR